MTPDLICSISGGLEMSWKYLHVKMVKKTKKTMIVVVVTFARVILFVRGSWCQNKNHDNGPYTHAHTS